MLLVFLSQRRIHVLTFVSLNAVDTLEILLGEGESHHDYKILLCERHAGMDLFEMRYLIE